MTCSMGVEWEKNRQMNRSRMSSRKGGMNSRTGVEAVER